MNKMMILAAALAAAFPNAALAIAPAPIAEAGATVHELTHIRTTLHGSKGPLIVLIPGLSTPGAVWDDSVAVFRSDHRLLVVEVKGFDGARVPANEGPGLLDGVVADLSTDLKARRLDQPTIVGHSLGGLLAMKFALAQPGQARQLLIVDALPFFGTVFGNDATLETIEPRAKQMRDMLLARADAMRAASAAARTIPPANPGMGMVLNPAGATKVAVWSMNAEPTIVAEAMYEDMMTDLRKDIAALKLPVTVLYQAEQGAEMATERYSADYAALPQVRLVPVARTSHFIMLDRPDVVHETIREMVTAR